MQNHITSNQCNTLDFSIKNIAQQCITKFKMSILYDEYIHHHMTKIALPR